MNIFLWGKIIFFRAITYKNEFDLAESMDECSFLNIL